MLLDLRFLWEQGAAPAPPVTGTGLPDWLRAEIEAAAAMDAEELEDEVEIALALAARRRW
jgi:hypothetical protein